MMQVNGRPAASQRRDRYAPPASLVNEQTNLSFSFAWRLDPSTNVGRAMAAAFAAALCAQLPVLETACLRLRAPHMGDFDAWAEILCGPAAQVVGGPVTRDEAFAEFASLGTWLLRGHGLWTVEPLAGGAPLGFVLIGFEPGDREPELVNLFRSTAEGQSHAFEAATAARDHARALGVDREFLGIDSGGQKRETEGPG